MKKKIKSTVVTLCGGGNAVHVLAADLGSRKSEYEVRVFAPYMDEAKRMKERASKGIQKLFRGEVVVGTPTCISNKPEEVVPGSDVIILPVPSFAHRSILEAIGPHLKENAIVGAMPGQGNFDMIARSCLPASRKDLVLFGFNQLPYQCRIQEYGASVELIGHKRMVKVATCPASACGRVADLFSHLLQYIDVKPLPHFLNVTLHPANQVIHPCIMYGLFHKYREGDVLEDAPLFYQNTDDFTANVLTGVSDEVQSVALQISSSTGIDLTGVPSLDSMMREMYVEEIEDASSMQSIFATNKGYAGLKAPMIPATPAPGFYPNFKYRYLVEDIPLGLCVIKGYAALVGVDTPVLDKVLLWAQEKMGKEYISGAGTKQLDGKDYKETTAPQALGINTLEEFHKLCL